VRRMTAPRRPGLRSPRSLRKVRLACGAAGSHTPCRPSSRPGGHGCQQQAAAGPLLDQVPGRKPELRPKLPASGADFPRFTCGRTRIGIWRVAGQPQRARHAWGDRVCQPCPGRRPPAIGQEIHSTLWSSATATDGPCTRLGLDRPAARRTDELVARSLRRQTADRRYLAGGRPEPHRPLSGRRQPKTARPGQDLACDPVAFIHHGRVTRNRTRNRRPGRSHGDSRPVRPRRPMP
jgi:hypothetical protein